MPRPASDSMFLSGKDRERDRERELNGRFVEIYTGIVSRRVIRRDDNFTRALAFLLDAICPFPLSKLSTTIVRAHVTRNYKIIIAITV